MKNENGPPRQAAVSTETLLAERGKTHGKFSEHARIAQWIKRCILCEAEREDRFEQLTDTELESLEMIAHKIGRILAGNPHYEDHWDDIAGYAKLVANEIRENKKCASPSPPTTPRPDLSGSLTSEDTPLRFTTPKVT